MNYDSDYDSGCEADLTDFNVDDFLMLFNKIDLERNKFNVINDEWTARFGNYNDGVLLEHLNASRILSNKREKICDALDEFKLEADAMLDYLRNEQLSALERRTINELYNEFTEFIHTEVEVPESEPERELSDLED